ncbi:hypothetical protein [Parenemella sanctibonifatiensis]|uniref:DUF4352 domain-containing protein n=1 Tax=Parenemella sanctibonifatiensis TaxID=2016505 RepID=A0A255EL51_9ACTN|nr:hypothetical protein [Parenemella sanctibonifatiensis]OYN90335.1 hypothetical protein CGZ91_09255 [Parenemella sanctibonifatiensis]
MDRRHLLGALGAAALVPLAACATQPPPSRGGGTSAPQPTGEPSAGEPGKTPVPEPTDDRLEVPETSPQGSEFTFEQQAEYPEGLIFSVEGATLAAADSTTDGAEGTNGELVAVDVVCGNLGSEPFDPRDIVVHLFYGEFDTGAQMVRDHGGNYGTGFGDEVAPGESISASIAFAVPHDQAGAITVEMRIPALEDTIHFRGAAIAG